MGEETSNPDYNFPGIFVPDPTRGQYTGNQQNLIDLLKQGAHTGMYPTPSLATDRTSMIQTMQEQINSLKNDKDRKGQCLHMLTDLYFNRKKLTFEECQNLLGMIHSVDEENLLMAELILKNKSNGRD